MDNEKNKLVYASLILGVSIIIGTIIVAQTFLSVKKLNDTLAVTGSAKERVTSDSVKWRSSFTRNALQADIKSGYGQMKKDEAAIIKFMKSNGIKSEDMIFSPVIMNEVYKQDQNAPKEYNLQQTVEVNSTDVQPITTLAKSIQPLVDQGVIFSTQGLEYYTSQLPELRVSMLDAAIKDAKARAEKIAESSGRKVGAIQSASMGIVQVMPVNSVDVSDYGSYDTSSIEKDVMVTVKTTFRLE
jgi:hypothetical protein